MSTVKATLTSEMRAVAQVALTKHISELQQHALDAKRLGLWENEAYFCAEVRVASAAYNAILRAE